MGRSVSVTLRSIACWTGPAAPEGAVPIGSGFEELQMVRLQEDGKNVPHDLRESRATSAHLIEW